jgi:plasmid replication initiation protein
MNPENQNLKIYKSNKLVMAAYATHSLHEQLLILSCLGIADPKTLTATTQVRLTVQRFADIADLNPLGAYDDLQRAAERLFDRWLMIDTPDPENPKAKKTKTRWVQSVTYEDGAVVLLFAHKIIPYLSQLEGCFTSYHLRQVAGFSSFYSHRIYELLVQFPKNRERTVTVEWLRENFALKDAYHRISDLKKWVIDTAIKDINAHTDLSASYTQRKRGKTIESFVFHYGPKSATKPADKPATTTRRSAKGQGQPTPQPPLVRPEKPKPRTTEQNAKAREALAAARKAVKTA